MWSPRRATTNRNQPKPCARTEPSPSTRLARLSWLHWAHVTVGDLTAALLDGAEIVALFQLLWLSINGACKCVNFLLIIDHQWMVLSENYQPYWHCSTQVLAWHTVRIALFWLGTEQETHHKLLDGHFYPWLTLQNVTFKYIPHLQLQISRSLFIIQGWRK